MLLAACYARCCVCIYSAPRPTIASTYVLSPHSSLWLAVAFRCLVAAPFSPTTVLLSPSYLGTLSQASPSSSATLLPRPSMLPYVSVLPHQSPLWSYVRGLCCSVLFRLVFFHPLSHCVTQSLVAHDCLIFCTPALCLTARILAASLSTTSELGLIPIAP